MPINLVTKFQPYTDEQFATESKKALVTNQDLDWTGVHTIKVYKVTTSAMNDYGRSGPQASGAGLALSKTWTPPRRSSR